MSRPTLREAVRRQYRRLRDSETVRDIFQTFGSKLSNIVIGLGTSVIIARTLGPDGKGVLALATLIASLCVQFGDLGIPSANTYFVSKDRDCVGKVVGNSAVLAGVGGGLLAVLIWSAVAVEPSLSPIHGTILLLTLISIPFRLLFSFLQNVLLGVQRMTQYNLLEPSQGVANLVLYIGLALVGFASPVWFLLAVLGVLIVVSAVLFGGFLIRSDAEIRVSRSLMKTMLSYGMKANVATIASFTVIRIDLLLVGYLLGDTAAGYYSISGSMINSLYMFPVAIGTVMLPKLTEIEDDQERWSVARRVILIVSGIAFAMAVIGIFAARPFILLLYTADFEPAITPFLVLLPAFVLLSVNTIFQNYFAAEGLPAVAYVSPLIAAVLNIGLNLYLLPRMGLVGAAVASVLAYASMLSVSLLYLYATIETQT